LLLVFCRVASDATVYGIGIDWYQKVPSARGRVTRLLFHSYLGSLSIWYEHLEWIDSSAERLVQFDEAHPVRLVVSRIPTSFRGFSLYFDLIKNDFLRDKVGFQLAAGTQPAAVGTLRPTRYYGIRMPYWLIMALFLLPAAAWLHRHVRRRYRLRHGLCLSCGYDLRESPAKCPECGAKVEKGGAGAEGAAVGGSGS
jgi:hypothetical protein